MELRKSLTIFFPCYNDAGTIGTLVAAAAIVASEYTDDWEIIVVDDGSTDSSRELLQQLTRKYPRLRVILHRKNRGYGAALRTGWAEATKELVFYTDGDGQYDVFELRKLLPVMQEGVDVVNGYKIDRSDPLHRIVLGAVYLWLMRLLFNFHVRDVDCDFRLMRRRVFDHIRLKHNSGVICLEMVKKLELAGCQFVDYPVHHYHRTYGRSQFFNLRRVGRVAVDVVRLWSELITLRRTQQEVTSHSGQGRASQDRSLLADAPLMEVSVRGDVGTRGADFIRADGAGADGLRALYSGRRVLITGGLGFIGSNLARRLVGWNAKVTIVDALIPEYGGSLFNIADVEKEVRIHTVDVRDERRMVSLIRGQDYLFNLAGQTSHLDSMRNPYTDLDINCRAQLSILEACRRYNPGVKVVYASTRQVYGVPDSLPVDERHLLHPVDVNGINKMAGEWYHVVYNNVYGVRACVLRLTNTYGPRMRVKDARQTFLGWWIRQILEGSTIEVYGQGRQLRDFTYVDDAVNALLLGVSTAGCHGQIYNLGGGPAVSLKEVAQLLVSLNGGGQYRMVPFPPDQKAIDIGDYYTNDHKFRSALGWRPQVPLQEGLARTLEYYREHRQHYWEPSSSSLSRLEASVSR